MTDTVETTEERLMKTLTNEPSEPMELPEYNIRVVFKRPPHREKYKGRAWAVKKLKEFGFENADEQDQSLATFIRYWGSMNTFVHRILVEDEKGTIKKGGKKYSEYEYDPKTDLDYGSLLEKYAIEEVYNKGLSDEHFISEIIVRHADWVDGVEIEEEDLKNS